MNTNSIAVYAVDNESFTPADIQVNVNTHSDAGIVSGVSLYLSESEARELLAGLRALLD
jgi:hypothetical protein